MKNCWVDLNAPSRTAQYWQNLRVMIFEVRRRTGKVHLVSWPWPLTFFTSKFNQFIFIPNCIEVVNLMKFPQAVYKISC